MPGKPFPPKAKDKGKAKDGKDAKKFPAFLKKGK